MGTFEGIIYFSERQGKVELIYLLVGRLLANLLSLPVRVVHNAK